ncbi:hypothetical protein BJX66DRAFT_342204 [Aspergillus keveii]|uniref:C2H2-type domain-containing protein n=1 Tax=Aspergillus keveii TaxID=714993 RepID=A0ABR4FSY7_9EURO
MTFRHIIGPSCCKVIPTMESALPGSLNECAPSDGIGYIPLQHEPRPPPTPTPSNEAAEDIPCRYENDAYTLWWLVLEGNPTTVEICLAQGADVNAAHNGTPPLVQSAMSGSEEVTAVFLQMHNIDINLPNYAGQTALWCAAHLGHSAIVQRLLEKDDINIECRDESGQTPLGTAVIEGYIDVVKLLLAKGADINARDDLYNLPPIFWAIHLKKAEIARLLISQESFDSTLQDRYDRTALERAQELDLPIFECPAYFQGSQSNQQHQSIPNFPNHGHNAQLVSDLSSEYALSATESTPQFVCGTYAPAWVDPNSIKCTPHSFHNVAAPVPADVRLEEFKKNIRSARQQIENGELSEGSTSLVGISVWLAHNAEEIGLTRDHQLPCPEHLSIWQDFNITWLALCQRHIDIGRIPGTGGSLLKRDQLENIAWILIEIGDRLEPKGLVDYEIGVWEEEILSGLCRCLDLVKVLECAGEFTLNNARPTTPLTGFENEEAARAKHNGENRLSADDDRWLHDYSRLDALLDYNSLTGRRLRISKLNRTITDVYQDELHNPAQAQRVPKQLGHQEQNLLASSYRNPLDDHPSAQTKAICLCKTGNSYDRSPFRRNSLLAAEFDHDVFPQPAVTSVPNPHPGIGIQQTQVEQPKTISSKDAVLHDFNQNEDQSLPYLQQSDFNLADTKLRQDNTIQPAPRFQSMESFPHLSQAPTSSSQSVVSSQPQQQSRRPSQQQNSPLHQNPDFPASSSRFKSTGSDVFSNGIASPSLPKTTPRHGSTINRPQDTSTNGGTYTCTYHGCTQRFETPSELQKHKRNAHRQTTPGGQQPGRDGTSRNSQAGPHRCDRFNPQTGKPCGSIFSRPYDLTRHEDTIHNARKQKTRCYLCTKEKTFSRNDVLTRHMRVVHPEVDWPSTQRRKLTEELASTQPDALAVCAWDEELAYGELDQLATRLMHRLMAEGVGPELLVPLCFEKSRVVRRDARCAQGRRRLRAAGPLPGPRPAVS